MYREDYQNDPLIAKTLIESGWAVKRLLENKTISYLTNMKSSGVNHE